jgi:hypothetical protein
MIVGVTDDTIDVGGTDGRIVRVPATWDFEVRVVSSELTRDDAAEAWRNKTRFVAVPLESDDDD